MKKLLLVMIGIAGVLAFATPSEAQVQWGVRGGLYLDNTDPFIGVEAIMPISRDLFFNPNVEYAGGDTDLVTLNADVHYDLIGAGKRMFWIGAGVAAVINDDDSDFGANLFAGLGTRWNGMVPYVQVKALLGDADQAVLGIGLRF